MNYDRLVNLIVDEIYAKLGNININSKKRNIVVFSEDSILELSHLKNENIIVFNNNITDCDEIIITDLSLEMLSALASGISNSKESNFILKMLFKGKNISILESGIEYKKYKSTSPITLYNKYIAFENEIKKYGIKIINNSLEICNNTEKSFENCTIKNDIKNSNVVDLTKNKLISESTIKRLRNKEINTIQISKKAIVTALASDFIRINNFNIERK